MEDEVLRAALAPTGDCLTVEQIGRYADGALGADERSAADRHLRDCLTCQAELALLHAMTSSSAARASASFPFRAVAAVLLVGVATGSFLMLRTRNAPDLPSRVTTGDEVTRSLAVTVSGPVGDQTELPQRFEWGAVEGAVRYQVRLMEVDRRELWSTSTASLAVDLPPPIRPSIVPGRTLQWDVTAYDAAGAAIAESGTQSFKVVPR